jgi:hypothetical protein
VDLPPEATALLAVPPARFTAERTAVARALTERGDPAAAAVRALRRPVGLAWVLNRLSRDHPREVRALLEAGDRLRSGQRRAISGAGAEALREAETAVRERARVLRLEAERLLSAEGRPAAAPTLARIELLLRIASTGPAREALAAASLTREPDVGEAGLSGLTLLAGGAAAAPPPPVSRARGAAAGPSRGSRAAGRTDAAREAKERKEREREARARAAQETRDSARRRRERSRAVASAHAEAARARARAEKAERSAERAEKAAREARERAAAARAEASRAAARALEVERTNR